MPKLWTETIDAHRRAVRDATLEATAALVAHHGVRSVTMSQIAKQTGIARATLYKYFPDVDSILIAWHQRQIEGHITQLEEISRGPGKAALRLRSVLEAYALIQHEHHGGDVAAALHRRPHVVRAQGRIQALLRDLVREGAGEGDLRDDIPSEELARYCLHALTGATGAPSKAAVRRVVDVTLDGLAGGGKK